MRGELNVANLKLSTVVGLMMKTGSQVTRTGWISLSTHTRILDGTGDVSNRRNKIVQRALRYGYVLDLKPDLQMAYVCNGLFLGYVWGRFPPH